MTMKTKQIDIAAFGYLPHETPIEWYQLNWRKDGKVILSNTCSVIEVDAGLVADAPEIDESRRQPKIDDVIPRVPDDGWSQLPEFEKCEQCDSHGLKRLECEKCAGYGEWTCSACDHDHECKECNNGSKVQVCKCGNTDINGVLISTRYMIALSKLPNVEVGGTTNLAFRFDGGRGAVASLRRND